MTALRTLLARQIGHKVGGKLPLETKSLCHAFALVEHA